MNIKAGAAWEKYLNWTNRSNGRSGRWGGRVWNMRLVGQTQGKQSSLQTDCGINGGRKWACTWGQWAERVEGMMFRWQPVEAVTLSSGLCSLPRCSLIPSDTCCLLPAVDLWSYSWSHNERHSCSLGSWPCRHVAQEEIMPKRLGKSNWLRGTGNTIGWKCCIPGTVPGPSQELLSTNRRWG